MGREGRVRRRAGRRTNVALLVLLVLAFATGWAAFGTGTTTPGWIVTVLHGAAGLALVLLVPWKSLIVRRSRAFRSASWRAAAGLVLGVLVAVSLLAGVVHVLGGFRTYAGLTPMQVHVGAAVLAVPFAVLHVLRHPQRPRRTDLSRRTLLRALWLGGGAAAAYVAVEGVARGLSLPGQDRRVTGSHEVGSDRPEAMPVTQWALDAVPRVDVAIWRLRVEVAGRQMAELDRDALLAMATDEMEAVLDCTGGWYADQRWRGVRLDRLLPASLPPDARSVVVVSVTGYARRLPLRDVPFLLIATHVADRPLSIGHGAPARLVAPGRRGFWWVKWLDRVVVDTRPWWWQPPFPLQ
ncbi:DMSO/TMAO reductase YedYZ molybdopterin-dependent catalytic subunit [Kribbella sp. VKM Ac-2527]|uniref:DMSO/TMAO reductase YedYZ molybdopterin-dependent catalytic subunit n=1 Tax=Kribbella caucasensis TaxID=2512215 RepID=A0A4R6KP80_9ACTN|nr:molybdopterin-dependent oxidoreductase [Kribbella sp. VKM Ac-2527]TDO54466.1 DMSO/TMAO reductase YedYZ molybdopterin-dependent catalytic subunit [Kribbella sp. VKM Ac-2527]